MLSYSGFLFTASAISALPGAKRQYPGSYGEAADSLLDNEFCQLYYPHQDQGYPPCEAVKSKVTFNHSRPLPTLELGNPSNPGLFFVHGWPDSGAEWAAQFAHFCYTGKYYCVSVTWDNFHPDFPNAPESSLTFVNQIDKIAATMSAVNMVDPTLVIHDWGSFLGYQMMWKHPALMKRTVSFDIGSGGHPNVTYQEQNREAYLAQDSTKSIGSADYWTAPCPSCAVWRAGWPYVFNMSFAGLVPHDQPPATNPLMFLWGNMSRGKPRGADSKFFDAAWLTFVESTPKGKVVECPSDHWMHVKAPRFVNTAVEAWLNTLH